MENKGLVIGVALAFTVFLAAGCVGAPQVKPPETGGETGGTGGENWCETGMTVTHTEFTYEVKGIKSYQGKGMDEPKDMCKMVHTTAEGGKSIMYETKDGETFCLINMKDGEVQEEFCEVNPQ